jgi:hypothetical protein
MFRTLAYATLFSTALIGSHAYGADNAAVPKDQPPPKLRRHPPSTS